MKLFIAGHQGMVGGALVRRFEREPGVQLLLRSRRDGLDLTNQASVEAFYAAEKPDVAIIAAAKVGGIHANDTYPAEFLFENLAIASNCVHSAWRAGVKRLLFLGSSCIYPKHAPQPMKEEYLLTGPLEPTNEWYAIAKIAGLKMCQAYRRQYGFRAISAMPTNLYGPGDNFSLRNSHVLPALMRKFHEAKERGEREVEIWGTGFPRREFLHVDDLADACLFLMQRYDEEGWVNVGWGKDVSIAELANLIARTVGFTGNLKFNPAMPDGSPRKTLDTRKLSELGWVPRISLEAGIAETHRWFLLNRSRLRD